MAGVQDYFASHKDSRFPELVFTHSAMSSLTQQALAYVVRHDSFQAVIVEALIVGIYTCIVLFTLYTIVSKRGIRAMLKPLNVLMIVMYGCALLHLGRYWRAMKLAFVDNANSPDAALKVLASDTKAGVVVSGMARAGIMFLADCILIWRCWTLWKWSWSVVSVPILLLLGEFASFIARLAFQVRPRSTIESRLVVAQLGTAHLSFTLSTTVLATLLIVYRLVYLGAAKHYRGILEVIIESSALYAVAVIVYLPFPLHPTMSTIIPNAILVPTPGIATTLIIARVSLGRGIESTFDEKAIAGIDGADSKVPPSTLRFESSFVGSRDEEAGGVSCHTDMQTLA